MSEFHFDPDIAGRGLVNIVSNSVKDAATDTTSENANSDEYAHWAIIANPDCCPWCFTLSSNGFFYNSEETASAALHDHCKCEVVADFEESPRVANYDPDGMRERLGDIAEEIGLDRHSSWTIKKGKLDPKFKAAIETENPEWILRGKVNRLSQSGALNSINDPDGIKRRKHAEVYYNSVKARNKDIVIQKIADSTGEDKEMAERVYNHVFVDKHNLAKGYGNFDPDYNMAQSFQRILAGEALEHDKILIKHENLEAMYMKQGMDYDSAHKKADLRYNYQKALDEFEKRKKNG